jgi:hypothetical protein
LDASRRASWRGSGRSATASWRLGASLRDVPPGSCCAAGAQGPDGEQRRRQQRPGDDRGGGGCPRRSAGSKCGCPTIWGTRAAAVSSLAAPPAFRCSQLEVPPRLGPTAALAPKTQSRLSRPGAGYGDFWRDRCGRAGSSGGGTSCRGSSATYFLVAHGDRSPGNYTNIASFLLKICGGNMRIDAPFCLKTQQYSLEQADGAEHWLR